MFVYEGKKTVESVDYEVLNIVFGATQVPATTPDVQVWKTGTTVHAKIGDNEITGTVS